MVEVDEQTIHGRVFQDLAWAQRGLDALQSGRVSRRVADDPRQGRAPRPPVSSKRSLGAPGERFELAGIGAVVGRGPLVDALQGDQRDLPKLGLSGTMRRVGFQPHDGRIFDALTTRGGILVAIHSEPRAADALALLHSYGGGNAAIGAWTGRV